MKSGKGEIYRVHETFESIQFEGHNCGRWALFVRFYGCNLRCNACDTEQIGFSELPLSDLLAEIRLSRAPLIVLTGGEPTRQRIDLLIEQLANKSQVIAIETNGTIPEMLAKAAVLKAWITFSPKQIKDWERRYQKTFELCSEIKAVYGTLEPKLLRMCEEVAFRRQIPLYLQPLEKGGKGRVFNTGKTLEYISAHPLWCLSFQTQKLLGLR
jgi:organic radical activating enzyme